jgi:hypothetical protein
MLPRQDGIKAFLDQTLACTRDSRETGVQGSNDPAVAPAFTGLGDIGLEQHTRLQDRRGRVLAFADQSFQRRPFVIAQANDILLDRSFRHIPIPRTIDDGARESEKQLRINDGGH